MSNFNASNKEKSYYTIVYRYESESPLFNYMYVPEEDWPMINEERGKQEEAPQVAAIIPYKVEPVEREDGSRWIKDWRIR